MRHNFIKLVLAVTLGVFVVLAAANWRFYFATPCHEQGDMAANALQIYQAKHGIELYGNYSRFLFNHPGPAFFYVYAFGERILRDWLAIVPSAYNAHMLTGLLLQGFFFAAALAIFAEHFRAPLFVPLALLLASIHFGFAHQGFISIWPPAVLIMPFLCFFSASASVASGRESHLPLAVVAGSFLVHGHVAQPLFVLVLFALAYRRLWQKTRRENPAAIPWKKFPAAHVAASAIALVFFLPLAVDCLQWPHDNLILILRHFKGGAGSHESVGHALLYFLTFFSYLNNPETLLQAHGMSGAHFLLDHAAWYLAWIALFGFLVWRWPSLKLIDGGNSLHFVQSTALLWLVTVLLCIVWGMAQDGGMFQFNGYFYFSLLYVPLLLVAAAVAGWFPKKSTWLFGIPLCLGATALAAHNFTVAPLSTDQSGIALLNATQAVLRADTRPDAPKILVFSHGDWPAVTSAALALERRHIPFFAHPILGFMFGRGHWLVSPLADDTLDSASTWRFLRRAPPGVGVPFVDGLRVTFSPGGLNPGDGMIDCSENGNLEQFVLTGFITPNDSSNGTFTDQPESVLEISSPPAAHDVVLSLRARPFLRRKKIDAQPMELWVNGIRVDGAVLDHDVEQTVTLRIPAGVWNRRPVVRLVMKFPAARSPAELGLNDDPRVLGWSIRSIALHYAN